MKQHRTPKNDPASVKRVIYRILSKNAGKSFLWASGIILGVIVGFLLIRWEFSARELYIAGFAFSLALCYAEISEDDPIFKENPVLIYIICLLLCSFWVVSFLRSAYRYTRYIENKTDGVNLTK